MQALGSPYANSKFMQTSGTLEVWLPCELSVGGLSFRGHSWGCLVSWGMQGMHGGALGDDGQTKMALGRVGMGAR